jgi:hypothetical protein
MTRTIVLSIIALACSTACGSAQVNTEALRRELQKPGLSGTVSLEFGLNKGNTDLTSVRGGLRLDYGMASAAAFCVAEYVLQQVGSLKVANEGFMHLRVIVPENGTVCGEAFAQKEFNAFLRLKDRMLAGAGARLHALAWRSLDSAGHLDLFFGTGAMYEDELFNSTPGLHRRLLRSTSYVNLSWQVTTTSLLSTVTYVQPAFADIGNVRLLSELTLRFTITRALAFSTALHYRYDRKPAVDVKPYDLELSNGISLTF